MVDSVTIGSGILAMLGFFTLFLSSKPVTMGSVLMTAVVAAAATQAATGILPAPPPAALQDGAPRPPDVVDYARMSWTYAAQYISGLKGEL